MKHLRRDALHAGDLDFVHDGTRPLRAGLRLFGGHGESLLSLVQANARRPVCQWLYNGKMMALERIDLRAMNSDIELLCGAPDAASRLRRAERWLNAFEARFSRCQPLSEL